MFYKRQIIKIKKVKNIIFINYMSKQLIREWLDGKSEEMQYIKLTNDILQHGTLEEGKCWNRENIKIVNLAKIISNICKL